MTENLTPQAEAELVARLSSVREDIAAAALATGRDPDEVRLVAVSKLHSAQAIRALARAGQRDFGESYVQEALAKREEPALASGELDIAWHFIGRLQTNKAKFVAGAFDLVHGVDSRKLAHALHKRAEAMDVRQRVLLQVNLAGEAQKAGVVPDHARQLATEVMDMPHLRLEGLMLMPPFFDDPERARPYFAELRELRDRLAAELGTPLPELSMGMTGDFREAVAEGATLVRVGTRIFGERPGRKRD